MFRQPGRARRVIQEIVVKFRENGATSPEKAMTAQELGLPPRFEEAMKRRLGKTEIFIELSGGKYYLDEARLRQLEQERGARRGGWAPRRNMLALRMVRMVIGLAVVVLVLSNIFFVESAYLKLVILGLVFVWIALTVFQLYYLSRGRSRMGASSVANSSL